MKKFLRHFFTPHLTNNYRPKLLHPQILVLLILFFFSLGIFTSFTRQKYPSVLGISSQISIDQLLILTNQQRQNNNLPPLSLNGTLSSAALAKGNYMLEKNFWAHIAPDGTTPWYFIKSAGYNYIYAGENLARGYDSAAGVVDAWMASPSHRENILSSNYKEVGFAVLDGNLTGENTILVVEMFGNKGEVQAAPNESTAPAQEVESSTPQIASQPAVKEEVKQEVKETKKEEPVAPTPAAPLINAQTFSSNLAMTTVAIFMFVLILDMIIIERKKIIRFVGHNLDHVLLFTLIGILLLVILKGYVL